MYHSVCAVPSTPAFAPYVVTPALLERQLSALAETGVVVESSAGRARSASGSGSVVLTFDDGYRDFYDVVLPMLDRLRMRAALFVPTGYLGRTARWLAPEGEDLRPILDAAQIRDIATSGLVDIGAHSHSHPPLDLVDAARRRAEIRVPRLILEDLVQAPVSAFAYPFGYFNRGALRDVAAAGYDLAYAVGERQLTARDHPLAIPRRSVTPETSPADLVSLVRRPATVGARVVTGAKRHLWRQRRRIARSPIVPQAGLPSARSRDLTVPEAGRGPA
jgi:peptidoglycan/xylan/chitin deacetylase (PgdA/CDA1 family)